MQCIYIQSHILKADTLRCHPQVKSLRDPLKRHEGTYLHTRSTLTVGELGIETPSAPTGVIS